MTTTVFSQITNPTNNPDMPQEQPLSPLQKQLETRQFIQTYSTENQEVYAAMPLKRCIDTAPSIQEVGRQYGTHIVKAWISALIMNLCEFCGLKVTANSEQMNSVAGIAMKEFGWLNAKELLVFFYRQKTGRYLTFYHTFDGSILCSALSASSSTNGWRRRGSSKRTGGRRSLTGGAANASPTTNTGVCWKPESWTICSRTRNWNISIALRGIRGERNGL